ncbi:NUDIX hydrolase [Spirochaetia bacterium]|nr:NUDIX hydrolase [Spirochaetia bacterium]GHU31712.1 NUDIX hydrolase [Spirochaetia bacterium]
MDDILFHTNNYIFSYRVAGILVCDDKVLLQKPENDEGFAFPGGHVAFGETNAETLRREFKEEIGADISVGELKWVAEIFFPWNKKPCHQICLYYLVYLNDDNKIQSFEKFIGKEQIEDRNFDIEFHWIPIDKIDEISIYPKDAALLLRHLDENVKHFIYRE